MTEAPATMPEIDWKKRALDAESQIAREVAAKFWAEKQLADLRATPEAVQDAEVNTDVERHKAWQEWIASQLGQCDGPCCHASFKAGYIAAYLAALAKTKTPVPEVVGLEEALKAHDVYHASKCEDYSLVAEFMSKHGQLPNSVIVEAARLYAQGHRAAPDAKPVTVQASELMDREGYELEIMKAITARELSISDDDAIALCDFIEFNYEILRKRPTPTIAGDRGKKPTLPIEDEVMKLIEATKNDRAYICPITVRSVVSQLWKAATYALSTPPETIPADDLKAVRELLAEAQSEAITENSYITKALAIIERMGKQS